MYQVGADQYMEMGGAAEGAAAFCGGGESHYVGDRSRADRGGPVETDVGVIGRIGDELSVGGLPWQWPDDGPLGSGNPHGTCGSTRVGR